VEGPSGTVDYRIEQQRQEKEVGGISRAEIDFEDGSSASIARDRERGVLTANIDGTVRFPESVTRATSQRLDQLIVRQLKRPEADRILLKVLPVAARLAKRVAR
jgi:hypothetical protein